MTAPIFLFDAYGTLFDVNDTARVAETMFAGQGAALAALWRDKQIAYTWLRTLGDRHADFRTVTGDALDFAAEKFGLALDPPGRARLLAAYEALPAFAEVAPALGALRAGGARLGILSNGTPQMLAAMIAAAGLGEAFEKVISIEGAGRFKIAPQAYRLAWEVFGVSPSEITFVSSNGWDAAGAGWFGYRVFWVNRSGQPPERLGISPAGEGRSLDELVRWAGY